MTDTPEWYCTQLGNSCQCIGVHDTVRQTCKFYRCGLPNPPITAPAFDNVSSLAAAAWERNTKPQAHPPRRALEMTLADIDSGKINPRHIIVIFAKPNENGADFGFNQSGDLDAWGQAGLTARIAAWFARGD